MDITIWIEVALFVLLMELSGFFSSCETSLFSLNKIQLEQMRRDGDPRTSLLERVRDVPVAGAVINYKKLTFIIQRGSARAIEEVRVRW